MALDAQLQGTEVVRRKLASIKFKIQAAEMRAEKAKQSLAVVQERFNRTMGMKAKMEELINKRESQLDRAETRIASIHRKWNALIRFCEEISLLSPGDDHGGQLCLEFDTKTSTFTKQTEGAAEKKCQASVDRERVLRDQTERARARYIRSETTVRVLQEQLTAIKERVHILQQRKQQRDALKRQTEALQDKVNKALARAHDYENMEAELEGRIIELEDEIGMYAQKKKRASSILADRDSHKSIDSWTIALWLRRSSLITATGLSSIPISIGGAKDA